MRDSANDKADITAFENLPPGQIAPRVLTCGDPWRAQSIAEKMENTTVVSKNREYWVFNGEYNGVPVTVASHGVGASGAAICFEELIRSGAKVIIRVGTCGTLQPEVVAGDLVVATGGVREDGVTPTTGTLILSCCG